MRPAGRFGRRRVRHDRNGQAVDPCNLIVGLVPDGPLAHGQEDGAPSAGSAAGRVRDDDGRLLGRRKRYYHHVGGGGGARRLKRRGRAPEPNRRGARGAAGKRHLRRVDVGQDGLGKLHAQRAAVQVQLGRRRADEFGGRAVRRDPQWHVLGAGKRVARHVKDGAGPNVEPDRRGRSVGRGDRPHVGGRQHEDDRGAVAPAVARRGAVERGPLPAAVVLDVQSRRVGRPRVDVLVECDPEGARLQVEKGRIGPEHGRHGVGSDGQRDRRRRTGRVARQVLERAGLRGQPSRAARDAGRDGRVPLRRRQRHRGRRRAGGGVRDGHRGAGQRVEYCGGGGGRQRQQGRHRRSRIDVLVEPHRERAVAQV